jgi:hypothetical protein
MFGSPSVIHWLHTYCKYIWYRHWDRHWKHKRATLALASYTLMSIQFISCLFPKGFWVVYIIKAKEERKEGREEGKNKGRQREGEKEKERISKNDKLHKNTKIDFTCPVQWATHYCLSIELAWLTSTIKQIVRCTNELSLTTAI